MEIELLLLFDSFVLKHQNIHEDSMTLSNLATILAEGL